MPITSRPLPSRSPACGIGSLILAAVAVIPLVGCQTPNTAPMVAPPATGMIRQAAPYNGYVSTPQGAAYPPAPVMSGPSSGW